MGLKSISTERFHTKISRHINLVSSYTELPELSWIIKSCRLKPYTLLTKEALDTIRLHNWWVDEYSNSLVLDKKKPSIILNDLKINRNLLVQTDLYEKLSFDKIARISKLAFIMFGLEEDFNSEHYIISFLGLDGFLRTYVYLYGELLRYPNLYLGLKTLGLISKNTDIRTFTELNIKNNIIYPCTRQRSYICSWPPTKGMLAEMKEQNESVLDLITF